MIRTADGVNEGFYGVPGVSVEGILSGQVKPPSGTSAQLNSTLNALEQQNPSLSGLPKPGSCPGDRRIRAPATTPMRSKFEQSLRDASGTSAVNDMDATVTKFFLSRLSNMYGGV